MHIFHKWTKWEKYDKPLPFEEIREHVTTKVIIHKPRKRRKCLKCGLTQELIDAGIMPGE